MAGRSELEHRGGGDPSPEQTTAAAAIGFDAGPSAVVLDRDGRITATNKAWRRISQVADGDPAATGVGADYLAVCAAAAAQGDDDAARIGGGIAALLEGRRRTWSTIYPCPAPLEDRWFQLRGTAIDAEAGGGAVITHLDVTPVRLRQQLHPMRWDRHESGLLSAEGLELRARELLEVHRTTQHPTGVARVSIPDLDAIHAREGSVVASQILATVVNRILRVAGNATEIARPEPTVLVALFPGASAAQTLGHVARLREALDAPILLEHGDLHITTTVEAGSTSDARSLVGSLHVGADRPTRGGNGARAGVVAPDVLLREVPTSAVFEALDEGIVLFDRAGRFRYATELGAELVRGIDLRTMEMEPGWRATDALGLPLTPSGQPAARALAAGHPVHGIVLSFTSPDGVERWFEVNSHPYAEAPGGPTIGVVSSVRDITLTRRAADRLRLQAELIDTLGVAVAAWSVTGEVLYLNPAAEELYGWSADEGIGRQVDELIPAVRGPEAAAAERAFRSEQTWSGELAVLRRDGTSVEVSSTVTPVWQEHQLLGFVGVTADISERREMERQVQHLVAHDPLTGAPNRRGFSMHLDHLLAGHHLDEGTDPVAPTVLLVDLDRLEQIGDAYGHEAADATVASAIAVLGRTIHDGDRLGRISDRTVAVCCVHPDVDPRRYGDDLRAALEDPLPALDTLVRVRASVGIGFGAAGETADDLLHRADTARMVARRTRSTVAYDDAMSEDIRHQMDIEQLVDRMIDAGEVELGYQPIVRLVDGVAVGAEALLRVTDATGAPVPAIEVVHVAERTGRICQLGELVLRAACHDAAHWRELAPELDLHVSVNISAHQLSDDRLVEAVRSACRDAGIPMRALWLEVTESALMNDPDRSVLLLGRLKALGVTLAADDFGTGYSSLAQLRSYPLDILKLDRSFVTDLPSDAQDLAIARAVAALAEAMDIRIVAEGIEEDEQLRILATLGIELGQGFRWSPALDDAAFSAWVRRDGERASQASTREASAPEEDHDPGPSGAEVGHLLAHELRGPLSAIVGYAGLLESGDEPDPQAAGAAIRRAARRIDAMLRGLVDRDRDLDVEVPAPAALLAIVRSVIEDYEGAGAEIVVATHDDDEDVRVLIADRTEIEQVLGNLLDNARRHAERGTPIEVAVHREGPWVEVAVSNEGEAIALEDVPRIFRKFGRATTRSGGSGLGLYVGRRLARANGGDLRHRARPGGGATFVLRLPVVEDEPLS